MKPKWCNVCVCRVRKTCQETAINKKKNVLQFARISPTVRGSAMGGFTTLTSGFRKGCKNVVWQNPETARFGIATANSWGGRALCSRSLHRRAFVGCPVSSPWVPSLPHRHSFLLTSSVRAVPRTCQNTTPRNRDSARIFCVCFVFFSAFSYSNSAVLPAAFADFLQLRKLM